MYIYTAAACAWMVTDSRASRLSSVGEERDEFPCACVCGRCLGGGRLVGGG